MSTLSLLLYITIAIALLLFLSFSPNHPISSSTHPRHHSPRRLNRRLILRSTNFTFTSDDRRHHHDPPVFDPVVADIERRFEDKEWERMYFEEHHKTLAEIARQHDEHRKQQQEVDHRSEHRYDDDEHYNQQRHEPEWEDFEHHDHPEEFINDEDKFNVTDRLVLIFPQIDVDPSDGFVSEKELTKWNLDQAMKEVLHRSQRELEMHDKNSDGVISLSEYEPPAWVKGADDNTSDNKTSGYEMGWWKEEHFNASDMNGDGLLNLTEFNDFLHPSDTKNPTLIQWLCKQEISERDTDKDGKINFDEFLHSLFDLVREYEEEGHNSTHESGNSEDRIAARKLFNVLDTDSDGFLTDKELLPIIGKLHPSEQYYAKQHADHIISQADLNKDGKLSLSEMLDNPYVFYSSMFSDEDEYDYDYHDELR